ncbi:ankyrin repeat domain-containing protein 26-like protein [Camelus ferus]|nr:ankyrin repeat domain-containing protein 26-like protein [Camelus ferus]
MTQTAVSSEVAKLGVGVKSCLVPAHRTVDEDVSFLLLPLNSERLSALFCSWSHIDAASTPKTALHLACVSGQSSVVALLIQWNCDLDACDKESKAALIKAVQCQNDGCVTVLLEHGADPNLEDDSQNTALHYVVLAENTSIATQLLRCNANLEAINEV